MKIRFLFTIVAFLLLSFCFGQNVTADKDSFAIMPQGDSYYFVKGTYFKPSTAELNKVDSIFKICASKNHLIHSRYNRQYLPYISKNGSKHVRVICLCKEGHNNKWKDGIILVDDGGDCYFELIINLKTNTFSDLMINGIG